jgi:HSP20 family protein
MSILTKYEPKTLSSWIDDFYGDFYSPRALSGGYPAVEVKEEKDHYVLTAEMPGLNREDINVVVKNGTLTLSGEKKHEKKEENEGYFYSERSYGRFERSFNLGEKIDENDVEASYKDGVLHITLKKSQEAKPKTVTIK